MPRVIVTAYEYENDLLPMVCAKCGNPAEVHVSRPLRFIKERGGGIQSAGLVFGLLFMPPLFIWIAYWLADEIRVRVPMCETHRDDWKWRDRAIYWFILPAWTLGVLFLHGVAIMYLTKGDEENVVAALVAMPGAIVVAALVENLVILYGAVRLFKQDKSTDVKMTGVHDNFVGELLDDRARDRVDNPERRLTQRGDVRDDFDDETW